MGDYWGIAFIYHETRNNDRGSSSWVFNKSFTGEQGSYHFPNFCDKIIRGKQPENCRGIQLGSLGAVYVACVGLRMLLSRIRNFWLNVTTGPSYDCVIGDPSSVLCLWRHTFLTYFRRKYSNWIPCVLATHSCILPSFLLTPSRSLQTVEKQMPSHL